MLTHVSHETIAPVFDSNSRSLVLGSIPSPKSREYGFYYMHPQNRFWPVLAKVFEKDLENTFRKRFSISNEEYIKVLKNFALSVHVALWDSLWSCDIDGAQDATIRNPVPNDFSQIFRRAHINTIFCTGTASYNLYQKFCAPQTGVDAVRLPSTSPANARWTVDKLVKEYRKIREAVEADLSGS
jgi:hypoxanthine-DNA glycosylase